MEKRHLPIGMHSMCSNKSKEMRSRGGEGAGGNSAHDDEALLPNDDHKGIIITMII